MAAVRLQAIEKWFDDVQVIKGLDLDIQEGEFIVLVGPDENNELCLLYTSPSPRDS